VEIHLSNSRKKLNITTGKLGYRSHNFGVFPFAIKNKQQIISVKNEEPGSLAITILPQKGIGLVQNTFEDLYSNCPVVILSSRLFTFKTIYP
jgi:hypothetical protein